MLQLERNAVQGRYIQLEMLRDSYLGRSEVFEKHQIFLALGAQGQLMGVLAAAITPIGINGEEIKVGICYDVRVDVAYRGHGLTKKMGLFAQSYFFDINNAAGYFLTVKSGNLAVNKSAEILGVDLYQYPFFYLTIPSWQRVGNKKTETTQQHFQVQFAPSPIHEEKYYQLFQNGLGVWHTHLMYRLRIRKLHPFLKVGQRLLNFFKKADHRLPSEGDELTFASLFGCTPENCGQLDEVLESLQNQGIGYLSVCCAKDDFLYSLLKPIAINAYPYILLSTFPTKPEDVVCMDVRCV